MKKKSYARILSILCPLLLCLLFLSFGPGDPHPLPVLSRIHFFCGTKVGNGAGAEAISGPECISGPEYISGTGWRSADDGYVSMPAAGSVSWNRKNGQKTGLYLYDEEESDEDGRQPSGGSDGASFFTAPFSPSVTRFEGNFYFYLFTALLHMGSALCIVCILHKMDGKKRYAP